MSVNIEQTIISTLRQLPPDKQQQVLDYVETLRQQDASEVKEPTSPRRSIWDKIEERMKQVPPEALAELPADASENLDHYLYGAPKK